MDQDQGEDLLHRLVLSEAFHNMNRDSKKIIVSAENHREAILNRDLLILFSGMFRDILSSVPQCSSSSAPISLIIPDLSVNIVMMVQDLLARGQSSDLARLEDSKELLEACQLLGLDIQRIHYEMLETDQTELEEVCFNLSDLQQDQLVAKVEQTKQEGKRIVFVNSGQSEDQHSPVSETPTVPDIQIKKEVDPEAMAETVAETVPETVPETTAETVEERDPEPEPNGKDSKMDTEETNSDPGEVAPPASDKEEKFADTISTKSKPDSSDPEKSNYECQLCQKTYKDILSLKKHLCIHFQSDLKKSYSKSYVKEKCLLCNKPVSNLRMFLLHVGLQHGKINEMLKEKGKKELPSVITKSSAANRVVSNSATPIRSPATATKSQNQSKPSKDVSSPAASMTNYPHPLQTPVRVRPVPEVPPTPASERKPLDSECNFNLHCQVCEQKMQNLHSLEQHLCRHYMKELTDSYSSLMDGMRCIICNNSFKQKHSLLLHLGCKHGKINDILRQKGLKVLPARVLTNPTTAMQKKLKEIEMEVKKERREADSPSNSGETLSEASEGQDPKPPGPSGTNNLRPETKSILEKFNINIDLKTINT